MAKFKFPNGATSPRQLRSKLNFSIQSVKPFSAQCPVLASMLLLVSVKTTSLTLLKCLRNGEHRYCPRRTHQKNNINRRQERQWKRSTEKTAETSSDDIICHAANEWL